MCIRDRVISPPWHPTWPHQNPKIRQLHVQKTYQWNYLIKILISPSLLHRCVQIRSSNRLRIFNPQHYQIIPHAKFSLYFYSWINCCSCLSHLTCLSPPLKCLILSDSLSSLFAIQNHQSPNPIVLRIHVLINSLNSSSISISFLWIPGHIDLKEHDAVDLAAKQSLLLPTITDPSPSPAYDLKSYYRSLSTSSWHDHWSLLPSNKLRSIKKFPIPWSSSNRPTRREEVVLTRLRIGHNRFTHSFLYLGLFAPPLHAITAAKTTCQFNTSFPALP